MKQYIKIIFSFNDTMYYYVKNLQGDVVKIIDKSGREVVTYTYDAWGKILNQTDSTIYNLANLNPFKYRSYVYDNESGLYYLQSRYYDPVTGRFLNADDTTFLSSKALLGENLFTYCFNNSIKYSDKFGSSGTVNGPSFIAPNFPLDDFSMEFIKYLAGYMCLGTLTLMNMDLTRYIIGLAAIAYLNPRGYIVAQLMFLHGLYGKGRDIGSDIKERMALKMMASYNFMEKVKETALENNGKEKGFPYEFKSGDLYYAIQHVDVSVQLRYLNDKRYIKVIVTDKFDFTELRWGFSVGDLANNLGLYLQFTHLLTPYYWEVTFTYHF